MFDSRKLLRVCVYAGVVCGLVLVLAWFYLMPAVLQSITPMNVSVFKFDEADYLFGLVVNKTLAGDGCVVSYEPKYVTRLCPTPQHCEDSKPYLLDRVVIHENTTLTIPSTMICDHVLVGECLRFNRNPLKLYSAVCPPEVVEANVSFVLTHLGE